MSDKERAISPHHQIDQDILELLTKQRQTESCSFAKVILCKGTRKTTHLPFFSLSPTMWALTSLLQEKLLFLTVKINERLGVAP